LSDLLNRRLALLDTDAARPLLARGLRGIERETLRVDGAGKLAMTPHARGLGSALTHPHITTDYAESLLEFITPAEHDIATALDKLDAIHRYALTKMDGELYWSQSMPCDLPPEKDIAIAWYGSSNMGMLKHVYRRGLALRYGKAMQCIAGIHYNYSLSEDLWALLKDREGAAGNAKDFQSERYFALIRNFRRYSWLLMYLFGASPALSRCFLRDREHNLDALSDDTLYLPYATSLRMSDLGYQNDAQSGLTPQENSLDSYVASLTNAVNKPYPPYAALGTQRDGEWIQISTNILQIENEYYATIRPKRVIRTGERPIQALCARGVQYVEIRCMDVDPFEPTGISLQTSRFLDVFLLYCAMADSAAIDEARSAEYTANFAVTVKEGRKPGLRLKREGADVGLRAWGEDLLDAFVPAAQLLDRLQGGDEHVRALDAQRGKLADPDTTPSARALAAIRATGGSFNAFGLEQSRRHAAHFASRPLTAQETAWFDDLAATSLAEQVQMEQQPEGSFEGFVSAYRTSTLCRVST
jgi:glutamate--cysteine ligase